MRISDLLKNEPFPEIFCQTLKAFWETTLNNTIEVSWGAAKGAQVWRGNPHLNFFCVKDVDVRCFNNIVSEFGWSRKRWRRALQCMYARLVVNPNTRWCFTPLSISVSNKVPQANELLIIGGRNRLRILHPRREITTVIRKSGAPLKAFEREIAARIGPASAVAPKWNGLFANGLAFSEQYIEGRPINRFGPKQTSQYREDALSILKNEVHLPTQAILTVSEYLINFRVRTKNFIGSHALEISLFNLLDFIEEEWHTEVISICFTHGDFQDANVLVNASQKNMIIDWETSSQRWSLYDHATMYSGIRLTTDRFRTWLGTAQDWVMRKISPDKTSINSNDGSICVLNASIWWIEDLLWRLEEAPNRPENAEVAVIQEISAVNRALKTFLVS